ncbi:MAG TPA: CocE/NonD family hydrolase [Gaiellaceae bacterium]|nr:CocE/NonD family hydrolase [Gaiellaceae bacterium]
MRSAVALLGLLLLGAAPAQAVAVRSGFETMADGTRIAYDLYEPDGAAPATGWPGVVVLHGLGGTKDAMAPIASYFASNGYAALAYSARGNGTSTGNVGLAGPDEVSDERAMLAFFEGLPEVSDNAVGAWGISYGGGQVWNGLAAGIPYKAADVVETWTNLYQALWPQNVARSGIVIGLAKAVDARSPLISHYEQDAERSTNLGAVKALVDARSALGAAPSTTTPVYMFQGRVDYAFDVSQALNAFAGAAGPRHLYIGQFGHTPSSFPGPDSAYVLAQSLAWLDRYVKGVPNGIEATKPVTIAAASGAKRVSFAGVPATKAVTIGFPGAALLRTGSKLETPLETFGVSTVDVRVRKLVHYPRLIATVYAGAQPITHGGIVPRLGSNRIRLANYVEYLPKGTRLTVRFGPDSGPADLAYLGFADQGSIALGAASLTLRALERPVTGGPATLRARP